MPGEVRCIGVIPWSPLARGRLTRDWEETTVRAETGAILPRKVEPGLSVGLSGPGGPTR